MLVLAGSILGGMGKVHLGGGNKSSALFPTLTEPSLTMIKISTAKSHETLHWRAKINWSHVYLIESL